MIAGVKKAPVRTVRPDRMSKLQTVVSGAVSGVGWTVQRKSRCWLRYGAADGAAAW
jgi:hypothetical protein